MLIAVVMLFGAIISTITALTMMVILDTRNEIIGLREHIDSVFYNMAPREETIQSLNDLNIIAREQDCRIIVLEEHRLTLDNMPHRAEYDC